MIGTHAVILNPGASQVDMSCLVDEVTIQHGRGDPNDQPEPSTCTLDLSLDTDGAALPTTLELGAIVQVTTTEGGSAASVRFRGKVTDITTGWDAAGEDTPEAVVAQIVCAGGLADLGRRTVGDTPWPQELDGARVERVLAAAGITLDPTWSDPGTVQVLARDVDSQPALALCQEVADSGNGVLWQTRTNEVRYADSEHRRAAVVALELDACDVLVTPTWQRNTGGVVNKITVSYGVAPSGGEQPQWTDLRTDSRTKFGEYDASVGSVLATLGDAQAFASLVLTRNSFPVWVMAALPVDVAFLNHTRTQALLGLDMHSLLHLTGLPGGALGPTEAWLWVEGWTETLRWEEHEIELWVSGYCRTVPAPRWDDVDPAWTWNTMP